MKNQIIKWQLIIMEMTEGRINEVEERPIANLGTSICLLSSQQMEANSWKKKKNEQSLRDLWYNNIRSNICIIGVTEGEEKTIEIKNIWRSNGWKLPQIGQKGISH